MKLFNLRSPKHPGSNSDTDLETTDCIPQLFSICAAMDEISGCSDEFLELLNDSCDDLLEDDELSFAAGGVKPFNPSKE